MVEENSKEHIIKEYSSVSEAIVMRLGIDDPLHMQSGGLAIEDDPSAAAAQKNKFAQKRARRKETRGSVSYYGPRNDRKYASYLRLAHESYIKMTDDYYGSQVGLGMWEVPKKFDNF